MTGEGAGPRQALMVSRLPVIMIITTAAPTLGGIIRPPS
jgi:hypothetical protein